MTSPLEPMASSPRHTLGLARRAPWRLGLRSGVLLLAGLVSCTPADHHREIFHGVPAPEVEAPVETITRPPVLNPFVQVALNHPALLGPQGRGLVLFPRQTVGGTVRTPPKMKFPEGYQDLLKTLASQGYSVQDFLPEPMTVVTPVGEVAEINTEELPPPGGFLLIRPDGKYRILSKVASPKELQKEVDSFF
ncbi:MAG: hypothetical protein OEV94_05270 [Deltaproteobacteria bacterium]|nr:hypothetical protein [Deltaproteobacteria bacterium]